jgi:RpiR family glv operon transcriptional regulator
MSQDFFEISAKALPRLNKTESSLYAYIVKNMGKVKRMSIQSLASELYLSTTTVFRFTRKLGFSGYSDFTESLLITDHNNTQPEIPSVVYAKKYSEEYLKNIMEAVRVMPADKVAAVMDVLTRKPFVYIITDSNANDIGRYCEKLFLGLGLRAYFPEVDYQEALLHDWITDNDLLIALSYSGNDEKLISSVEHVFLSKRPFLLSVTRADNNILQNMSDVNFYVFADEIRLHGVDMTSRISMIMLLELIVYNAMVET